MQKFVSVVIVVALIFGVILFCGFTKEQDKQSELFRIHIIANSNLEVDSEVKYKIKDEFSKFLTPCLASCQSKTEVKQIVNDNLNSLKVIADGIIKSYHLQYDSKVEICTEYFPTRSYGEYVVEGGNYDGITVTLGQGKGDNWWCVMFPPLCYYNTDYTSNYGNVVYKSKIMEIIKQFFEN